MTEEEKSSFLSLVDRFLSWRESFKEEYASPKHLTFPRFRKDDTGCIYLSYETRPMNLTWNVCSGRSFRECAENAVIYMNYLTKTSGREELELFLDTLGI